MIQIHGFNFFTKQDEWIELFIDFKSTFKSCNPNRSLSYSLCVIGMHDVAETRMQLHVSTSLVV